VSRTNTLAYFSRLTPTLAIAPFITILDLLNTNTLAYFVLPSRMKIQHWVQAFLFVAMLHLPKTNTLAYLAAVTIIKKYSVLI